MTRLRRLCSRSVALLGVLVLLAACGGYDGLFRYAPSPALVLLEGEGQVLAAVEGLRTVGEDEDERYVFDLRLLFDHRDSAAAWTFDPADVSLTTGELVRLDAHPSDHLESLNIPDGSSVDVALAFALPVGSGPDDLDLSGLHLSLRLGRAAGTGVVSVGFERRVIVSSYHDHWGWHGRHPRYGWHAPWYRYDTRYFVPVRRVRRGRRRR